MKINIYYILACIVFISYCVFYWIVPGATIYYYILGIVAILLIWSALWYGKNKIDNKKEGE